MDSPPILDVSEVFAGRRILFAGATGFVGKVALSMLLDRYGEALDHVLVVVRRGSSPSAERRFLDKIATSEPFKPLREALGDDGALDFLRRKCTVLEGDVTDPHFGLGAARL